MPLDVEGGDPPPFRRDALIVAGAGAVYPARRGVGAGDAEVQREVLPVEGEVPHVPVVEHGRPGLQPGPFPVAPLGRPLQASFDLLGVYELQAVQRAVPLRVDAPDPEVDTERIAHGVQVSQRRDVNPDRASCRFGGDPAFRPLVLGPRPRREEQDQGDHRQEGSGSAPEREARRRDHLRILQPAGLDGLLQRRD